MTIHFLTPEQFATVLAFDLATVYRWLEKGTIRAKKINRSWRIPHTEVERIGKWNTIEDVQREGVVRNGS